MKLFYLVCAFIFLTGVASPGCTSIPYADDIEFPNSAQSGRYEFPVRVADEIPCTDVQGHVGACVVQLPADKPVMFGHDAQNFAYTLQLKCPKIGVEEDRDIPKATQYTAVIEPNHFETTRTFICEGELFPMDRSNSLSVKWRVQVLLYDPDYQKREVIYKIKDRLILGQYAKDSVVCNKKGRCRRFRKKTVLTRRQSRNAAFVYSISEKMRINQWPR